MLCIASLATPLGSTYRYICVQAVHEPNPTFQHWCTYANGACGSGGSYRGLLKVIFDHLPRGCLVVAPALKSWIGLGPEYFCANSSWLEGMVMGYILPVSFPLPWISVGLHQHIHVRINTIHELKTCDSFLPFFEIKVWNTFFFPKENIPSSVGIKDPLKNNKTPYIRGFNENQTMPCVSLWGFPGGYHWDVGLISGAG